MQQSFIKRFAIVGLHYYQNFEMKFDSTITILVGENGLGKTTVLNTLYALLTKKWAFLSGVGFDFIDLEFLNGNTISFSHSELDSYLILKYFDKTRSESATVEKFEVVEKNIRDELKKFSLFEKIISKSLDGPVLYLSSIRGLRDDLKVLGRSLSDSTYEGFSAYNDEFGLIADEILIPYDMTYISHRSFKKTKLENIMRFMATCNSYLVNTALSFDFHTKSLKIENKFSKELISFEQLSSGEKQILFIFMSIYMSDESNLCILFDEPELSLSLTWQRKILQDVVNSDNCSFLLSITHSPFVFDNSLEQYAKGINTCFN